MIARSQWLGLIGLTLAWGINWPIMKLGLQDMPALHYRALTMMGGTLCMAAWFLLKGIPLWPAGRGAWRHIAALALPNMLGWHLLAILGVQSLASGRAAMLGFTMPIWTVLIGVLFEGEKLSLRVLLGVAGVAASVALLLGSELNTLQGRPIGVAWMMLAAVLWAVGTRMIRRTPQTLPLVSIETITLGMMVLTGPCLYLLASVVEGPLTWRATPGLAVSLAFGVFINYVLGQLLWFSLARHLPPVTSAMSVMAVPLVGTLGGVLILHESPRWTDAAAMLFVMLAIASVLVPPRRATSTLKENTP